jgi:lipopolysaccharide biosynthesis glycosyltransferase
MIFGHQLRDFLKWLEERISSNTISAMAAFCVASDHKDGLSSDLKSIPHNSLYPAGGTLYFDVGRYIHFSIYDRLISAFTLHRDKLIYAEQDLLCLILTDDELSAFHECGVRCHIDLAGLDGWKVIEHYESLYLSRDFFYIKHVGSFKPWKKWVVHPSKAIFLRERKNVEHLLGMENLECLRDSQLIPENLEYLAQQFMLLETLYEKSITLHSS